ncbi:hypothetical protein [Gillisia limnaea]|uniref:Uncharacterized protein n=1 Tax=Gillisia limnaea (strain DSM 15749 / LMG 21470 / R-8282) TaxID=865937 RepID=H2BXP1_GILLR|nr:hypothetical protein [Gillisia limnaea]EHQ03165.1 hypothetical protein Gilli_2545 [Gillisia limnaea DSM 15749]
MERIEIEVADETAKKWRKVPMKVRQHLEKSFDEQIQNIFDKNKHLKFEILLNKISDEAQANGLTEEILQEILNENE